jgi:hypothetical protein
MLFKEFTVLLNPQSRKMVMGISLNAIGGIMLGANLATAWVVTMFIGCFLSIPIFLAMKAMTSRITSA